MNQELKFFEKSSLLNAKKFKKKLNFKITSLALLKYESHLFYFLIISENLLAFKTEF
jgi:hypothetical protein